VATCCQDNRRDLRRALARSRTSGSTGIPKRPGEASWLLLDLSDDPQHPGDLAHGIVDGLRAEHRMVSFDVDAVARDLRARLHPNAEFLEAILTGKRPQIREPHGH
jgi:hypothetical protein